MAESQERRNAAPRKRALVPGSATHPTLFFPHGVIAQVFMKTKIDHANKGIVTKIRHSAVNSQILISDGVKMVKERLITLAWRLHNDLSNDILDRVNDKKTRVICGLNSKFYFLNQSKIEAALYVTLLLLLCFYN